jgi:hypothetical protein
MKRPLGSGVDIETDYKETGLTGFIRLRIGPVAGFCEHSNEPSGKIKAGTFLTI